MRTFYVLLTCFIFASGLPLSVSSEGNQDPRQHLKIQKSAKMHGVHSERLADVMRRMIAHLMKGAPAADDAEKQSRYQARMVKLAEKVRMTAKSIDKYMSNDELDEEEIAKFRELATQLYEEAKGAQTASDAGDADAMNASLDRLHQTCVSCHRLFREM